MSDRCKSHCNACGQETSHAELHVTRVPQANEASRGIYCPELALELDHVLCEFAVVKCEGCGEIHFSQRDSYGLPEEVFETDPDLADQLSEVDFGDYVYETRYPPKQSLGGRPEWLNQLLTRLDQDVRPDDEAVPRMPEVLKAIIREVERAEEAQCVRLATMGLRTMVDIVSSDRLGVDAGNFQKKLDKLVVAEFLSPRNAEIVYKAVDLGNAVAHRGHGPSTDQYSAAKDIVESLLREMYWAPELADRLAKATPKRKGRE